MQSQTTCAAIFVHSALNLLNEDLYKYLTLLDTVMYGILDLGKTSDRFVSLINAMKFTPEFFYSSGFFHSRTF